MTDAFAVDPDQLIRHVSKIRAVRDRLDQVTAASRAIAEDGAAYGELCGWISAVLEGRHQRQDELYAIVDRNLRLAADALTATAEAYDATDRAAAVRIGQAGGER